jgi:GTPase SAR1 family protein
MTFSGFLWTFSRGILDSHQRTLLAEKGVWSMVKMGLSAEAPKVSQCCWSQRLFRKKMSIREVKIVFLGSSGVGKTSLVRSFVTKQFTPNVDTTIGASYLTKVMRVDGVGKTEEYEGVTQIVKVSLSQLTGLVNLKVLLGGNFEDSIYYSKI